MAENFLFHEVDEKEKREIEREAKKIMDNFSSKLSKINLKTGEPMIERDECVREEKDGKCEDISKKIMFENAPSKNDNFIIAEKKGW